MDSDALFVPVDADTSYKYRHARHTPDLWMLWDEKGLFHKRQVLADYDAVSPWCGFIAPAAPDNLPGTFMRMKTGRVLRISISGDSISEGYNASARMGLAPFRPCYADRLVSCLKASGINVLLNNLAVGGWNSAKGRDDADRQAALGADLVIIAYGMNDANGTVKAYLDNIRLIRDAYRKHNSGVEFILVASMLPNPAWSYPLDPEIFEEFRVGLSAMAGADTAFLDMTACWRALSGRKRHHDLTGNGLNHPNDFGQGMYAGQLLRLLGQPQSESCNS